MRIKRIGIRKSQLILVGQMIGFSILKNTSDRVDDVSHIHLQGIIRAQVISRAGRGGDVRGHAGSHTIMIFENLDALVVQGHWILAQQEAVVGELGISMRPPTGNTKNRVADGQHMWATQLLADLLIELGHISITVRAGGPMKGRRVVNASKVVLEAESYP